MTPVAAEEWQGVFYRIRGQISLDHLPQHVRTGGQTSQFPRCLQQPRDSAYGAQPMGVTLTGHWKAEQREKSEGQFIPSRAGRPEACLDQIRDFLSSQCCSSCPTILFTVQLFYHLVSPRIRFPVLNSAHSVSLVGLGWL